MKEGPQEMAVGKPSPYSRSRQEWQVKDTDAGRGKEMRRDQKNSIRPAPEKRKKKFRPAVTTLRRRETFERGAQCG